jgi:hypothetical protein
MSRADHRRMVLVLKSRRPKIDEPDICAFQDSLGLAIALLRGVSCAPRHGTCTRPRAGPVRGKIAAHPLALDE